MAVGVSGESYSRARPFRPLAVTLTDHQELRTTAVLVDVLSWGCLSRPAALVAESPAVRGYGKALWIADLCHLEILLFGIWTLVLVTFRWAERRWLHLIRLG
jgi:hypothetical protein